MPDAPRPQPDLAAAIRQIRLREELTQEELALRAGVHLTWVSKAEQGYKDMRWASVCKIAGGLGVTVLELVALAERLEVG